MTSATQLTRTEVLALPPIITIAQLAACLGVSQPTIRRSLHNGELAALGIRINKIGAQHRVVTASVLEHLGLIGRLAEPMGQTQRQVRDGAA